MAKNWANGVPDEGRSSESGYRMAAEGIQFPWRGNGSTIFTVLNAIWRMSVCCPEQLSIIFKDVNKFIFRSRGNGKIGSFGEAFTWPTPSKHQHT